MLLQSSRVGGRIMLRRPWRGWTLAAAALAPIIFAGFVLGDANRSSAQERQTVWAPKLFGFEMEVTDAELRSLSQEAQMLRELGFDGAGYLLWYESPNKRFRKLGEDLDANLRTLDDAGLPLLGVGAVVNVDPNARPYEPRLAEAIRKLKGRPLIIGVMLAGLDSGDERGTKPAVKILRQLGDLAAESNLRISVYHHVFSWCRRFDHALRVVKEADHPRVGVNFNLPHWLTLDGDKDYRPLLRNGAEKVFVVTICGAKVGGTTPEELIQPLDRGDFDNRQLLATLREIGYRGPIGLQCHGIPGDAREHLQRSMNVWKAWKAEWEERSP
ncbi:MAG: sugar phosphate isomerase/epimerase family protein [Planctomycetota bacterium]|jgi:sugar phosphate isomerase/epimerase